ncbi:MAG: DUF47 family protein [Micromonosporaceae bacterium]|nr:DUF47 family protein [Micromonosporaceae bacterium]
MLFTMRRETPAFYELFGQAAANLADGTDLLADLTRPGADTRAISARLADLKHANEAITREVSRQISRTFVTPFDRDDVYRLASQLSDVTGHVEAIGGLLHLYGLGALPALPGELADLIQVLRAQATATVPAVARLRPTKDLAVFLSEWEAKLAGFWMECDRLEHEGDRLHRAVLAELFSGRYDDLTALKMKEIADEMEAACDAFEQVSIIIETIVFKAN